MALVLVGSVLGIGFLLFVAVVGHDTPATIAGLRTSGVYHVLTLRFSSSARRASLSPYSVFDGLVIGIEPSFLHGRTWLALPAA